MMFSHKQLAHLSLVALAALSCAAFAGDPRSAAATKVAAVDGKPIVETVSTSELTEQLIGGWEATLTQSYGWGQDGVEQLRQRVSVLPAETLKAMAAATTWQRFTELMIDAERVGAASAISKNGFAPDERNPDFAKTMLIARKTLALGDENRDLVFIPTKPCRVFDTRFETAGNGSPFTGRYPNASTKFFWVFHAAASGDFSPWGGNSGCTENSQTNPLTLAGTAPYAVMIRLTIVGPAAAFSFVSAVRSGDTNPAPNIVSAFCDQGGAAPCSSTVVIPVCRGTTGCAGTRDLEILSNMALDVAGEVQGYFIKPQASPLVCSNVYAASALSVAPGTDGCQDPPACPAGSTFTAPLFDNSTFGGLVVSQMNGLGRAGTLICARNTGGVAQTWTAGARCCKTPGR